MPQFESAQDLRLHMLEEIAGALHWHQEASRTPLEAMAEAIHAFLGLCLRRGSPRPPSKDEFGLVRQDINAGLQACNVSPAILTKTAGTS